MTYLLWIVQFTLAVMSLSATLPGRRPLTQHDWSHVILVTDIFVAIVGLIIVAFVGAKTPGQPEIVGAYSTEALLAWRFLLCLIPLIAWLVGSLLAPKPKYLIERL